MRLLVIEDNVRFYQEYLLRHLASLTKMEKVEVTYASDPIRAAELLFSQEFDVISIDNDLGAGAKVALLDGEKQIEVEVRKAADLITLRRAQENAGKVHKSVILAFGMTRAGNTELMRAGANAEALKIHVSVLGKHIDQVLAKEKK